MGLSVLPPPATIPTIALQKPGMVLLLPEGSLILVFLPSSEWPMMMVDVPEALEKDPLSPVLASQLETIVPSGSWLTGRMFPTLNEAIFINQLKFCLNILIFYPSVQRRYIVRCKVPLQQRNTQIFVWICRDLWTRLWRGVLHDRNHGRFPWQHLWCIYIIFWVEDRLIFEMMISDLPFFLCEIKGSELSGSHSLWGVGSEDWTASLSLCYNRMWVK